MQNLTDIIQTLTGLALSVVPVLASLALLYFFGGIAVSIFNAGDKDGIKKGRERMLWGFIALFFILSLGGLVYLLDNTFFRNSLHTTPSSFPSNRFPTSGSKILNPDPDNPFGSGGSSVPFDSVHENPPGTGGGAAEIP